MKGGVAMMLAAELELSTRIPDRDLIFAYFADEEMGGGLGSAWLVANRPELFDGARWAIGEIGGFRVALPDGRGVYPLQVAEKGMLWVRISVPGVSGHAAFSTGPNPVVRVGELVDRITKLPANATTPPGYDAMIRDLADLGVLDPAEPDASLRELGGFWAAAWWGARTKYTPTVVTAGDNLNVVPDFATLQVDCRFVPGDGEAALERLRTVLDDDMSLEVLIQSTALESPIDSELVQHVRQAVANADPTGVVVPFVLPAGTDAQELAKLGIAGYGFMPLMLPPGFEYFESMHAIDEHVPVDALVGGYQILRHLVLGL
jgi:acetylornithine deacetylase/succinyl-diaminopimelate desuccinylase-like protein